MGPSSAGAASARWTAAARARESARPDRLFDDPWAYQLAGPDGFASLEAREPDGNPNPYLPVRTRFMDDFVLENSAWAEQIVLLGAGHDTRSLRLGLPADLRVFALDHPDVLRATESVIGPLQAASEGRATWIPVPADLSTAWWAALLSAGFDPRLPSLWIAEGLLFYLSEEQVGTVLSAAAQLSLASGALAADVFGTGLLDLASMKPLVVQRGATGARLPFAQTGPSTF